MSKFDWFQLDYFQSGEWQVIEERLNDMDARMELYNPKRELLFNSLDATPYSKVKVAILGQDPYPDRNCACGIAFSIPNGSIPTGMMLPPTLDNIFKEYEHDLHYSRPKTTDLLPWCKEGVLLWNVIPTCKWQHSMSHDWTEYGPLTAEIIDRLNDRSIVFVFMGGVAKRYLKYANRAHNIILETSHPVPRASKWSNNPFTGSRIFTRINDALHTLGKEPVDWKLI